MIITENQFAGLIYGEQPASPDAMPPDAVYDNQDIAYQYRLDIRQDRNHPSGAQAHGNLVAIAMEGGPEEHASVDFWQFIPNQEPELVNQLVLDGTRGEVFQGDGSGASAAGFVQLEDDHFLVAIAGRNHGTEGIWFYYSESTQIELRTQWRYIGHWVDECAGRDALRVCNIGCFGGAAGLALLADCDGSVYLVAMNGTDTTAGEETQWMQLFKVEQNSEGEVHLDVAITQCDDTGLFQTNNPAFRWAGGVYVSEEGRPILFNSDRRLVDNFPATLEGDLYYDDSLDSVVAQKVK